MKSLNNFLLTFSIVFSIFLSMGIAYAFDASFQDFPSSVNANENFNVNVKVSGVSINYSSAEVSLTLNTDFSTTEQTTKTCLLTDGICTTTWSVLSTTTGTYTQPFSASSTIGDESVTTNSPDLEITETNPDYSLQFTASPTSITAGGAEITLTLTVTNNGGEASTTANLDLASDWTLKTGTESVDLGSIAKDSSETTTWTITAPQTPQSSNIMSVSVSGGGSSRTDDLIISYGPPVTPTMAGTLTLKDVYYPSERLECRLSLTDSAGTIITDASVRGTLTFGETTSYITFSHSFLCDCYKEWHWFSEGSMPGTRTLTVTATHSDYDTLTITKSFDLIKPSLELILTTDKTEYNIGDMIKISAKATDSQGNAITNAYLTGEIRDAETGGLIGSIYPRWKESENAYIYNYYFRSEMLGKKLNVSVTGSWKEQKTTSSTIVSITKRGLNGDLSLEKNVFSPGDILTAKIKVFDKNGNTISDAHVSAQLLDSKGRSTRFLKAEYKDGYYYLDEYYIDEWIKTGTYTLKVSVIKYEEKITIEKKVEIKKEKVGVEIIFDENTYRQEEMIYLKILVTHPDGSTITDAFVSGEIFPLEQEVREIEGWGETPKVCRMYVNPEGPIYYMGNFIQKYYVESIRIPTWCPTGTYVLRLKVSKPGYDDVELTKEFQVLLGKINIETGFKIESQVGSANVFIYAEVKDDKNEPMRNVDIMGYFHPVAGKACIKRTGHFGYDDYTKRFTSKIHLSESECPEGNYMLEIEAKNPAFETAKVEEIVEVKYKEGYEYNVVLPPTIPPEKCKKNVVDKECLKACTSKLKEAEVQTEEIEKETKNCVEACHKEVDCRAISVIPVDEEEMLRKLEEIHTEIKETREEVGVVSRMLEGFIDLITSILSRFGIIGQISVIQAVPIEILPEEALEEPVANESPIESI